jgi:hypothetical protein
VATNQVSESVAVFLLLLRELEASLQRSIRAIVLMDVAVLEAETRQQLGLSRAISVATPRGAYSRLLNGTTESMKWGLTEMGLTKIRLTKIRLTKMELAESELLESELHESELHESEWRAEVWQSRGRIIEAVRLQAALLSRARGKLRVLANMLRGPSALYGPLGRPSGSWRI